MGVCIRHYQQVFHPDPELINKQQLDQRMATLGFGRKVKKGGLELIKKMIAEEAALEDEVQHSLEADRSAPSPRLPVKEEPSRVRFDETVSVEEAVESDDHVSEEYDSDELTQAQAKLRDMFKASPTLYTDPEEGNKEEGEEEEEGDMHSESNISTPILRRREEPREVPLNHDVEASRVTLSPAQNPEDLSQLLSTLTSDLSDLGFDSALAAELGIDDIEAKLRQMERQEDTLLRSMDALHMSGVLDDSGIMGEEPPLQLNLDDVMSEELDKEELTVRTLPPQRSVLSEEPSFAFPDPSPPRDPSPPLSPVREPVVPSEPALMTPLSPRIASPRSSNEEAAETLAVLIESTTQSKEEEERQAQAEQQEAERIRQEIEAETQRTRDRLAEETKQRLAEEEAKCKASLEQLQALEDARILQENEIAKQRREREAQQEEQWKVRQQKLQEKLRAAESSPVPPSQPESPDPSTLLPEAPVEQEANPEDGKDPEKQEELLRRKEELAERKRKIREKRKSLGQTNLVHQVEEAFAEETGKSEESDLLAQRRRELSERKAQLQQRSRQLSEKSLASQQLIASRSTADANANVNEEVQERKKSLIEQQKEVDTLRRKHEEEGQSLTSALQDESKESNARLLLAEEQKRIQALIQQRKEALRRQKQLLLEKQKKELQERREQEEHLSFTSDSSTVRPLSPKEREERQTAYLHRIIQETSINVDTLIEDVQNTIYSPNPARRAAAIQEATTPRVNSMRMPGGAFYSGPVGNSGKGEGHGRIRYPDGGLNEGNVIAGFRHGLGSMIYSNGDRYVGHWDDDQPHGMGSYIPQEGEPYEGEWQHGQRI